MAGRDGKGWEGMGRDGILTRDSHKAKDQINIEDDFPVLYRRTAREGNGSDGNLTRHSH